MTRPKAFLSYDKPKTLADLVRNSLSIRECCWTVMIFAGGVTWPQRRELWDCVGRDGAFVHPRDPVPACPGQGQGSLRVQGQVQAGALPWGRPLGPPRREEPRGDQQESGGKLFLQSKVRSTHCKLFAKSSTFLRRLLQTGGKIGVFATMSVWGQALKGRGFLGSYYYAYEW